MSWTNNIGSCFGIVDHKFALHPSDAKAANELLAQALKDGVGFDEFCNEIRKWLELEGCTEEHISEQMVNVEKASSYLQYD